MEKYLSVEDVKVWIKEFLVSCKCFVSRRKTSQPERRSDEEVIDFIHHSHYSVAAATMMTRIVSTATARSVSSRPTFFHLG